MSTVHSGLGISELKGPLFLSGCHLGLLMSQKPECHVHMGHPKVTLAPALRLPDICHSPGHWTWRLMCDSAASEPHPSKVEHGVEVEWVMSSHRFGLVSGNVIS